MGYKSDSYYLEKVLKNDISAYSSLVDKHKDMVFTAAFRILRNREDAEEIAQDVFIKAYKSLKSFKKESKFSTWLYRIAYNAAISKTRKKRVETIEMEQNIVENFSTDQIREDVNHLDINEQKDLINKIIGSLTPEENTLINLFYFRECSTEEISGIMSLSQANVKVKLHRVRKRMYKEIQQLLQKDRKEIYR